jgi:2-hydroxy-3-keto-5-methylthiopentenyl-1-phosphate phosphatase
MLLLLDFDGTLTDVDTLDLLVAEHAPAIWLEAEQALTTGSMTLNEVIAFEFAHVRSTLDEALAVLRDRVTLRPGLPDLVTFCRERFIDPVVISSGFHELIEPVLAWGGVRLPVVAHTATFSPDGTTIEFLQRPVCPVCGEQCKRMELERLSTGRQIAYVGDGWSDRCAAKAADVVFARASLAQHLTEEGVDYLPFDDLADVREGLRRYLAPA